MKILSKIGSLVAAAVLAGSSFAAAADTVTIDGSTTVGPIAKAFAEYFMKKNPGVKVSVSESGSGNGAKSLLNGTCEIADMSRFMKPKEFAAAVAKGISPVAHVVAMDGLAVIVHPSNPVKNLTMAQIKDIYTGKITSWKALGGPDQKIVVISRDTNSGTYETFEKLVMKKEKMVDSTEYVGSNGAARARVQSTNFAIAYVGLGFVDKSIKALTVNKMPATPRTVASGVYPIARPLYMFTNGYPKLGTPLHQFITLYLTPDGQKMVEKIGFVPVTMY